MKKYFKIMVMFACILALNACAAIDDGNVAALPGDEGEEFQQDEDTSYPGDEEQYGEEEQNNDEDQSDSGDVDENGDGPVTQEAIGMMFECYQEFKDEAEADPERLKEVTPESKSIRIIDCETWEVREENRDVCTINIDGQQMQYSMEVIGEPDENGKYPLYITLHGGGEGDPETNNDAWLTMMEYYNTNITNGIYVATRGMKDVWNMHFLDEAYPMYDRLIEDMILLKNADPNRVYLLGFSAGGDGVYAIAPRMADRFAAANMSSGHPNGVSLLNTSNLPFEIQVGICDFYSEDALRSVRGAEFEETLNGYNESYGFGYPHSVLVHVPEGHNYNDCINDDDGNIVLADPTEFVRRFYSEDLLNKFLDHYASLGNERSISELSYQSGPEIYEGMLDYIMNGLGFEVGTTDTNAVNYVNECERDSCPASFIWDLATRAPKRKDTAFYWLKADYSVDKGLIEASYDKDSNTVYLEAHEAPNGEIKILASPLMMNFDIPLTIVTKDETWTVDLKADRDIMARSIRETGDICLSWADEISVTSLSDH